ncbi:MAG: hypothetical protein ACRDQW_14130 [Haloechinothrix sp.]
MSPARSLPGQSSASASELSTALISGKELAMWLHVTLVAMLAVIFLVRLTVALRHR